jgi:hypothetical protein
MNKCKPILLATTLLLFAHMGFAANHVLTAKLEKEHGDFSQGRVLIIHDLSAECIANGNTCYTYIGFKARLAKNRGPFTVTLNENTYPVMVEYSICKVIAASNISVGSHGWESQLPASINSTNCLRNSQGELSVNYTANHTFDNWGIKITKEGTGKWAKDAILREYSK